MYRCCCAVVPLRALVGMSLRVLPAAFSAVVSALLPLATAILAIWIARERVSPYFFLPVLIAAAEGRVL